MERLAKLSEAWTELATTRLKGVDLISCDTDTAEQTVTALRKTPDTQLAARKKVRQLRTLAESYEIQQRLFELTYLRREYLKDSRNWTKPSTDTQPGLVGPVAKPPTTDESILEAPRVIDAHRSLSRVKRQMLQSWIDYQMVRLDLYSDLAMSPP